MLLPLGQTATRIITHASTAAGVGRAFSRICQFVHALTGKRLELSTPNLVHVHSIAVAWHALTQRLKGHGHTVTQTVPVTWRLVTMSRIQHTNTPLCYLQPLPAWVYMSIWLPTFSSYVHYQNRQRIQRIQKETHVNRNLHTHKQVSGLLR